MSAISLAPVSIVALQTRRAELIKILSKNQHRSYRELYQNELNRIVAELKRADKAQKQGGPVVQMP